MDFGKFEKKMQEHLEQVMFPKEDSSAAFGFNYGARTMYNYAIVTFLEMMRKDEKE